MRSNPNPSPNPNPNPHPYPYPYPYPYPLTATLTLTRLQKMRADIEAKDKELTTQKVESAMMTGAMLATAAAQGATVTG